MLLHNLTQELGAQVLSIHHLPAYEKLRKTTAIKKTRSVLFSGVYLFVYMACDSQTSESYTEHARQPHHWPIKQKQRISYSLQGYCPLQTLHAHPYAVLCKVP